VIDNGHTVLVESFLDLRVQKQAEELRVARDAAVEASLAKSQFLATMSHELRTPLNAIIGYSELLQEEAADLNAPGILPDLRKIEAASKHLLGLINDVLDLSKIEAGKMQLNPTTFEVEALITNVVGTLGLMAEKNGNRIKVECSGRIGRVRADEVKVRQVLMNLLSNAIKFTRDGTIRVRAGRRIGSEHDWLDLWVNDTGIGMNEEQMSRLFQVFTQADSSTTRKYSGTGLGMAIAKRICEMMGGDMTVESRPHEGSAFHVTLAVEPVHEPLD
jgi:signal transduction histidine kinase